MATLSTKKKTSGYPGMGGTVAEVRSLRGNRHPELKYRGQKRCDPTRVTRCYPIGVTQCFRRSLKREKKDNDTSTCKTQDTQGRKRLEVLKDGVACSEFFGVRGQARRAPPPLGSPGPRREAAQARCWGSWGWVACPSGSQKRSQGGGRTPRSFRPG